MYCSACCIRYACRAMGNGTRPFDKQWVFQAICQLQPMVVHNELFSVVDVRTFREAVSPEERVHTGCHPYNLAQFVQHTNLRPFLKFMKATLNEALDKNVEDAQLSLAFVSNSGRHRAVSAGKVIAECVLADPRVRLGQIIYLTDQTKEGSCMMCQRCSFWTQRWVQRNDALRQAVAVWNGC